MPLLEAVHELLGNPISGVPATRRSKAIFQTEGYQATGHRPAGFASTCHPGAKGGCDLQRYFIGESELGRKSRQNGLASGKAL